MELSTGVREKNLIQSRVVVAALGGVLLLSLLLARLIWLQLVETERFQTASEANRLQTLPVGPARGLIIDRNGVVLAENRPNLQLLLIPEEVTDLDELIAKSDSVLNSPIAIRSVLLKTCRPVVQTA